MLANNASCCLRPRLGACLDVHHLDEVSATVAARQLLSGRLALLAVVDEALNPDETTVVLLGVAVGVPSSSLLQGTDASLKLATRRASDSGTSNHNTTVAFLDSVLVGDENRRSEGSAVVDAGVELEVILDERDVNSSTATDRVCSTVALGYGDVHIATRRAGDRRHLKVPVDEGLRPVCNDGLGPGAAGLSFLERHVLKRHLSLLRGSFLRLASGEHGPGRIKGWGLGRDSKSLQLGAVFILGQVLGCIGISTIFA